MLCDRLILIMFVVAGLIVDLPDDTLKKLRTMTMALYFAMCRADHVTRPALAAVELASNSRCSYLAVVFFMALPQNA